MSLMKVLASRARSDAVEIQRIIVAADAVISAKQCQEVDTLSVAETELRYVVQAANDQGVSWQSIGDAMGLRRGAAYQRYRHRSGTRMPSCPNHASGPARRTKTK